MESRYKTSNSIVGEEDPILMQITETAVKANSKMLFKSEKKKSQTPLHYAFKSGNVEIAIEMIAACKQ